MIALPRKDLSIAGDQNIVLKIEVVAYHYAPLGLGISYATSKFRFVAIIRFWLN